MIDILYIYILANAKKIVNVIINQGFIVTHKYMHVLHRTITTFVTSSIHILENLFFNYFKNIRCFFININCTVFNFLKYFMKYTSNQLNELFVTLHLILHLKIQLISHLMLQLLFHNSFLLFFHWQNLMAYLSLLL